MATSRIFVRGLPPSVSEAELRKHFSAKRHEITDVKLIPQRRIGYLGFKTPEDAQAVIKYFNKSYIRMSKIFVESARPISDHPTKAHAQPRHHDFQPPRAAGNAASNTTNVHDGEDNSRKRKREEIDQSDPKLREYLHTMKSGRDSVLDDTKSATTDTLAVSSLPGKDGEGESDDEYENIPVRKEKQRRTLPPETQDMNTPTPVPKPEALHEGEGAGAETNVVSSSEAPSKLLEKSASSEATDEDWLRSRTNRVLDLADPEDLIPVVTHIPESGSAGQDNGESRHTTQAHDAVDDVAGPEEAPQEPAVEESGTDTVLDQIHRSARLFVRNLPYGVTEDDMREAFESFGTLVEVHVPANAAGDAKGFALILFADPSNAVAAFQAMDGITFQGRLLHIIPAKEKRDQGLDEFEISKLPLKKQNMIRKRADAASTTFNWNSLYMNQDAVNASVANRLGVSKSELLDPTSADAAVKQAIAETSIIQDTKAYFAANGVELESFKSHKRGDTAILVKNFPYGTSTEELRALFEESGPVLRVLMPPSGTIAIVQFSQASHAKAAFGKLAYRRIKDSVLFLEKAPRDIFGNKPLGDPTNPKDQAIGAKSQPIGKQKLSGSELMPRDDGAVDSVETTSLFVRNLNFTTTTSKLEEAFKSLDGFVAARVKTKMDPKKPDQTLSMGFGFVEFRTKEQAHSALQTMNGYVLEDHVLAVKASHKGHDAAEERRREDKAKKAASQRTKIVIKNLPFQASKKDIRALFGTYGQLRSVRVPKKADYSARGFAFADFVTSREAENALNALRDTHLLGRRLVLDFAEAEAVDAEEEIEKMQRKVGGQVNKVALQKLTGGGRRRVNIGDNEEEDEG